MYTVEHEFYPGEKVFVVINNNTVRAAKVLQVDIKIYEKKNEFIEYVSYLVLLESDLNTARVELDDIFANVDDALSKVREKFVDSVT